MAAGAALRLREHKRVLEFDINEPRDNKLCDAVAVVHRVFDIGSDRIERDEHLSAIVRIERTEGGKDALAGEPATRAELRIEPLRDFHREARGDNDRVLADRNRTIREAGMDVPAGRELGRAVGETRAGSDRLDTNRFGHEAKRTGEAGEAKRNLHTA